MITAANNSRLSRRVLWGIIFLYILPGLFARSPWSPDDAIGFGQAWYLSQVPVSEWALSSFGDRLFTQEGMLSAWLAAALAKLGFAVGLPLRWIDDAMRLGNAFWLILAGWAIWNTTYRLARRAELQPEDPFGNAPSRIDYARAVADASVLCLLGTAGLLMRSHWQVAELAELSGISLILLAAVRSLDRPMGAGWMLGVGIAIAMFARGWAHWVPFLALLLVSSMTHPSLSFCLVQRIARAILVAGGLFLGWFFWLMSSPDGEVWWNGWTQWNSTRYLLLDPHTDFTLDTLKVTLKTLAWFLWPILPMSIWTVWRYRHATREPAIRIPISAALGGLLALVLTNPGEEANYFPLLAPLSVLAAIGLSTMRKGLISLIDWFALLCFSFGAILVWIGWSAATFGWPERMAKNFEKLSPGYVPEVIGLELAIALLATAAWIRLVLWRTGRSTTKSKALWRPMVLTSGGVTLIWLLLMTLWLPRIDYAKSYRVLASDLTSQLASQNGGALPCVIDYDLGFAQRALLEYHSGATLRAQDPTKAACDFLIFEDNLKTDLAMKKAFDSQFGNEWEEVWRGNRNSDRHNRFILYKKKKQDQAG